MISSTSHQAWLFYSPLALQASLLKDDLLDPVDPLLDDPVLLDLVGQCLATRSPASALTGRPGIAADRLLRCTVMKHLKGWSFRDLERELRSNLVYRRFTHFDAEIIPAYTTFSRTFALLTPAVTKTIHQRVVGLAQEQGVAQGRKLRTDTTVVESNVHYPTDSSLLGDGIRVLSRSLGRIASQCKSGVLAVVNHARAVKYRLLEISRAAKEHPQLKLHMGIHSGAVSGVVDVSGRANIAGAGINIAQRVPKRWERRPQERVRNYSRAEHRAERRLSLRILAQSCCLKPVWPRRYRRD